jgi:hypothetical protein
VFSLMNSPAAICRFVRPSATWASVPARGQQPEARRGVDRFVDGSGRRLRLEVQPGPRGQRRDLASERLGAQPFGRGEGRPQGLGGEAAVAARGQPCLGLAPPRVRGRVWAAGITAVLTGRDGCAARDVPGNRRS